MAATTPIYRRLVAGVGGACLIVALFCRGPGLTESIAPGGSSTGWRRCSSWSPACSGSSRRSPAGNSARAARSIAHRGNRPTQHHLDVVARLVDSLRLSRTRHSSAGRFRRADLGGSNRIRGRGLPPSAGSAMVPAHRNRRTDAGLDAQHGAERRQRDVRLHCAAVHVPLHDTGCEVDRAVVADRVVRHVEDQLVGGHRPGLVRPGIDLVRGQRSTVKG